MVISPVEDLDPVEAAAIEAATGGQVRETLRPYLPHLADVNPQAVAYLSTKGSSRPGCDWIAAFRNPTRFGWKRNRWSAALNAEIVNVLNGLCALEEAAYRAHHGITGKPDATEPA